MILQTQHLTFSYSPQKTIHFPDLQVKQGEHFVILGKSGSGKSTFLHLLLGLLKAKTGEITVLGKNLREMKEREKDAFRGKNMGVIFQQAHLLKSLTVKQNIELVGKMTGIRIENQAVTEIMQRLNIENLANQFPGQLSVGEAQRVSIARALIHHPTLIFADEPTSSLDDENCQQVLDLLKKEAELHGATLCIVTHDLRVKERFSTFVVLGEG
ncbi:MAG: ABC transporter ATP-binding protein [Bacteroidia bacterium]